MKFTVRMQNSKIDTTQILDTNHTEFVHSMSQIMVDAEVMVLAYVFIDKTMGEPTTVTITKIQKGELEHEEEKA